MPGLLSGLFDGSDDQGPFETANAIQSDGSVADETATEDGGGQPELVPEDYHPEPVGILGDEPNEGATV